ncbi:hypothetical protein G7047_05880 [Diaphorobacter sp. HDW4A]|uniref:hypothetical protein n=1 Tax=Diaphorobacter sp. HDW4A TaxID=2714924 RepID=UPI001408C17A|nr:hypothetical protein [Diaphorobacter sp. HDW4A]QIL79482.1 hypothetical protein G7047_05880 [Diaphorobacter sp. HDW4A]
MNSKSFGNAIEYFHQTTSSKIAMPVELLVDIVKQGLPATISDSISIDKLRILRAARLIEADIPPPGVEGVAIVHVITHEGHSLLKRLRSERDIV